MTPDSARDRPVGERLTHLEDLLKANNALLAQMNATFDRRIAMLEVNVRSLEDRELRRRVLDEERLHATRDATAAANAASERLAVARRDERRERVTRFQFVVGVTLTCGATILASLLASGRIF